MRILFILLGTLLIGMLFEATAPLQKLLPGTIGFPFYHLRIPPINYIYDIATHVVEITYVSVIYCLSTEYKSSIKIFLALIILDLIDYTLIHNEAWFYVDLFGLYGAPVTFNVLKVFTFMLAIGYEITVDFLTEAF